MSTNYETVWSSIATQFPNFINSTTSNIHIFSGYIFLAVSSSSGTNSGVLRNTFPTPTTWTNIIPGKGICGMDDDGTYLYLFCTANSGGAVPQGFNRCDVNGNLDNTWYINSSASIFQITINNGYIYGTKQSSATILIVSIAGQNVITNTWANIKTLSTDLSSCTGLGITSIGNNLYANTNNPSVLVKIPIVSGNPPTSGTISLLDSSANDPYLVYNNGNTTNFLTKYFDKSIIMDFSTLTGGYMNIHRQYDLAGNLLPPIVSSLPITNTFAGICTNGIHLYAYNNSNGNIYQYQLGSMSLTNNFKLTGAFSYVH